MNQMKLAGGLVIVAVAIAAAIFKGSAPSVEAQTPAREVPAPRANTPAVAGVPDANFLRWPVAAADHAYTAIDGVRIKQHVKELTAISRRYRDAGHQYWGRLIGLESDTWTAEWLAQRLRDAGAVNVRIQPIDLPPQWVPKAWELTAIGSGQSIALASAQPGRGSIGITAQELDVVYAGLGTEADFSGRDVRGKVALIYGMPIPGARTTSASLNGTFQRAIDKGAAAIVLVVGLPGNVSSMVSVISRDDDDPAPQGSTSRGVPAFTVGSSDGEAIRRLIERAPAGRAARLKLRLDVEMVPGLKTANVWGEIPGTSDEDMMLVAHRDGYFEAAGDNATGVASLVALAEYFAKMPKEKRRRTIRLVGSPGHHGGGGSAGVNWMAENKDTIFPKTAYLINLEHTGHAQILATASGLTSNNVQGNYGWGATGSVAAIRIATNAYDAFGIPRRGQNSGGPGAESNRVAPFVAASTGVIHAAALYHTDAETDDTIPAYGVEATTRAYAKILDEVNKLSIDELRSPAASTARRER